MKEIRIAYIIDPSTLVLNVGNVDGIEKGQRFLVYGLSDDEIIDPQTGDSLGYLEIVRGTGSVSYVQEKMCIIQSDKPTPTTNLSIAHAIGAVKYQPFSSPQVGDYAREI